MGLENLLLYLAAFGVLFIGSNLIIDTISTFTRRVKVPPFIFSFFIVGILTSVAEIAVGINALSLHQPEIFVGSLLGGTLVIFLVVIPLMTILSGGLPVKKHLGNKNLLVTLGIIATPALFALDQTVTKTEALILLVLYISLMYIVRSPSNGLKNVESAIKKESKSLRENSLLRLGFGALLVFICSRFIVQQTLVYSEHFQVSPFLISLIIIAIGTNLPEIALAVKAATSHQLKAQDIAIGDFLGSAAANVLFMATFTLINSGDVITTKNFTTAFLCTVLAVVSFYAFTRGKSILTVKESYVLITVYLLFVVTQFVTA